MAKSTKVATAQQDIQSLDAEQLRGLLGDVQRRLVEIGGGAGAGGLQIRNVGKTSLEVLTAAGSTKVAAGSATKLKPEPVRLDSQADDDTRATASRPRSVAAFRLSVSAKSAGTVRVELGGLATGAARFGQPEALVRGEDGSWVLMAQPSFELTVDPGQAVDVFVVGRGPLFDASELARSAFAGLERAGGEA